MTLEQIAEVHNILGSSSASEVICAANSVLIFSQSPERVTNEAEGMALLKNLLQLFLDNDQYLEAGALLWPRHMFDPRPQFTKDIFKAIVEENQLLIPGANGTSKSYSITAFMYLDWRRDPAFTKIVASAVNEEHLKRTLMAQVQQFHVAAAIPMDQKITSNELYFGLEGIPDMGIAGVLLPQGSEGTGRIRGYKPKPLRKEKHPRFGHSSRVRFFGDEGQIYRPSVFKDFGSMQSAMNGPDPVKIIITYNPDSTDRPVVKRAMPPQGWLIEDLEILYRYKSKEGWSVLRLDAAKCENVIQRKDAYPGLQSFEGYMKFVQGGGDTSSDYFEKARGYPPIKGAVNIIIPTNAPQEYRGEANFIEPPTVFATIDCAYQGEDNPILTIGRYGSAAGWTKENGEKLVFTDYLKPTERKPRHILQIDQQIQLINRDDTVSLSEEIIAKCKELRIKPENVGVDGTGNGFGTYSHLKNYWEKGKVSNILLVQWARKATEKKILNEDKEGANAVYDTIISEMWFTVRRWFESGCIIISPMIAHSPLNQQLTNRRYARVRGGLMHVESKAEYKSRGNSSPDEADSLIMMPYVIRHTHPILPGMQVDSEEEKPQNEEEQHHDIDEARHLDPDLVETDRHLVTYEATTKDSLS
jgi:hypothetical protein